MDLNETEVLLEQLKDICTRLGWSLAIDMSGDTVDGMIIGQDEYMDSVFSGDEDYEDYDYYSPGDMYGVVQ